MGFFNFCMPFQSYESRSKASKCKKPIEQLLYRLKLLQARKSTIITQTCEDIAKLLQLGDFQRASNLVEELYREKCRATAYILITGAGECISHNLTSITRNRDITNMTVDVKEAVSSLIYAASRCGELPELIKLRSLFQNWYSNEFDGNTVNLLPTNLVKSELKNALSIGSVSNEEKLELIKEIIKDYADMYCSSMNCQQVCDVVDEKHNLKDNQALNNGKSSLEKPKHTESMQSLPDRMILHSFKPDLLSKSSRDSALQTLHLNDKDIYVIHEEQYEGYQEQGLKYEKGLSKFPKKPIPGYISKKASNGSHEMNYIDDASSRESSESTPQIQEKDIVYLDDIKEKTLPQSYYDYEAANLSPNSNGVGKRTLLCCDTNAYQPLPQEPSKKESNKHNLKKSAGDDNKSRVRTEPSSNLRQSHDGRMKQDMQLSKKRTLYGFFEKEGGDGNKFLLGHVHPKLPHYEELEAKFKHPEAGVRKGIKK